jgi:hypothetical protein
MAANKPLTDVEKQTIADAYKTFREEGLGAQKAQEKAGALVGVSARTARNYTGFDILLASDSHIQHETGDFVKGSSTLYDENGNVKLRWVKTDKKFDAEQAKEWLDALLSKEKRRVPPAKMPVIHSNDTLTVIPMGDPHVGMLSWQEETGDNFDLDIATTDLCNAVERLVKSTPASRECLIVNLGDYFHADNQNNETARGHNKLDVDGRWTKVLLAGLKAMRQCITTALTHHEKVTVINAIGNHDDHTSMFLTIALTNIYENEPRLNVINSPTIVHYYEYGENLIGVHHGHTIKPDKLPLIMATDRPEAWSRCKNRYWLVGHLHTDIVREYQGVRVENFRTLAGRDAWAASMGYRSGRDLKAIIMHRKFGEVARHICSIDMLRTEQ